MKRRIDVLLVERDLAASRDRARRLIMAGQVLVDDRVVDKAGTRVPVDAAIRLKRPDHPYVGRGGLKLEGALEDFDLDVRGLRCLDVGASTGGFADCLLQRGAAHVVAVDVGTNQLAWKLRSDPRVTSIERTDVRALTRDQLGGSIALVVVDASFISLRLLLPALVRLMDPGARLLALVKPQFEVGREHIARGGLVRDEEQRLAAVARIVEQARVRGFEVLGQADSRVLGARAGNREVFVLARFLPEGDPDSSW
jgi:23S rRNA (cytidine1920-2'-O)/16S rRNA (cytidine1409-2'-O)-methyltransferase